MAILDIDLTIQTSDAFSDSNNTIITVGFDPRTSQDSVLKRVNLVANTEKLIFSNAEYGKSYLYLKNMGSEDINIQATGGSTIYASLAELEFAFIPWNGTLDLYAESSANNIVEVGIFEV